MTSIIEEMLRQLHTDEQTLIPRYAPQQIRIRRRRLRRSRPPIRRRQSIG